MHAARPAVSFRNILSRLSLSYSQVRSILTKLEAALQRQQALSKEQEGEQSGSVQQRQQASAAAGQQQVVAAEEEQEQRAPH